jgi:hypothetical protein
MAFRLSLIVTSLVWPRAQRRTFRIKVAVVPGQDRAASADFKMIPSLDDLKWADRRPSH